MRIFRFRSGGALSTSYGYIRANFLETIWIRGRIAGGDTRIREVPRAPGPARYKARFIITGRRNSRSKCQQFVEDIARHPRPVVKTKLVRSFNIFGLIFKVYDKETIYE